MAAVMAECGRVRRSPGESRHVGICQFGRAIRLMLLLPLFASVVFAQPMAPAQQLDFHPYHASSLYDVGNTVGWVVSPGPTAPTYVYKWTIRRNNKDVLKEGKLDLRSGKDRIEIVSDEPEMIYVAIEPYANLAGDNAVNDQGASAGTNATPGAAPAFVGGNTGRNNGLYAVGAAVAPRKLGLSTPRPPDFDAFWAGKLAAQARVSINPAVTSIQSDMPGIEESAFALDALGSKVHGYVAKPATPGRFPAILQLQYAGIYALDPHWAAQRASDGWFVIDVDAHDKLPSDPS